MDPPPELLVKLEPLEYMLAASPNGICLLFLSVARFPQIFLSLSRYKNSASFLYCWKDCKYLFSI